MRTNTNNIETAEIRAAIENEPRTKAQNRMLLDYILASGEADAIDAAAWSLKLVAGHVLDTNPIPE